eukprot:scaffold4219_cov142-Skeletonema_menzelii.AAC.12
MAAPAPYHPPLTLPSIQHIALSSKSYRVFGLADEAWQIARDDLMAKRIGGGEGGNSETEGEMMEICDAVCTALQEDAGGFGTAGFHLEKVQDVKLSTTNSAMFTGTLYPNDPTTVATGNEEPLRHVSLTPQRLTELNNPTKKNQRGNDDYYSTLFEHGHNNTTKTDAGNHDPDGGRFKLRVVISKANEGVTATKYYNGLFDFVSQSLDDNSSSNGNGGITEEMVQQNDQLQRLKQQVLDARIANQDEVNSDNDDASENHHSSSNSNMGGNDQPILGYEVTIMLCEPHIQNEDIVIPPPSYLDKCHANFKAVPCLNEEDDDGASFNECRRNSHNSQGGVFSNGNVCQSLQFVAPGPWEKANLNAFELIALDIKKALVRVEFPIFPEGCREKTFREVYQLNARVSSCHFVPWTCANHFCGST